MGRRSEMESLVERIEASRAARERTKVILLTLAGQWSVRAGFDRLGVSRTRFQDLRRRCLDGAARAVEERPAGRPRRVARVDPDLVPVLRRCIQELKGDIRRLRTELHLARSGVGEVIERRRTAKAVRR